MHKKPEKTSTSSTWMVISVWLLMPGFLQTGHVKFSFKTLFEILSSEVNTLSWWIDSIWSSSLKSDSNDFWQKGQEYSSMLVGFLHINVYSLFTTINKLQAIGKTLYLSLCTLSKWSWTEDEFVEENSHNGHWIRGEISFPSKYKKIVFGKKMTVISVSIFHERHGWG